MQLQILQHSSCSQVELGRFEGAAPCVWFDVIHWLQARHSWTWVKPEGLPLSSYVPHVVVPKCISQPFSVAGSSSCSGQRVVCEQTPPAVNLLALRLIRSSVSVTSPLFRTIPDQCSIWSEKQRRAAGLELLRPSETFVFFVTISWTFEMGGHRNSSHLQRLVTVSLPNV